MDIIDKAFNELDSNALYDILKLRVDVFVVEQTCPYPELDNKDRLSGARHIYLKNDEAVIACARCLAPDDVFTGSSAIGRIAVAANERGHGYARLIINKAIDVCRERWPNNPVMMSAQTYLLDFYQSFGFQSVGEPYEEDGIPHQDMVLHTL
ncbi:GNAT family N-acetyltransferase [uncultured Endozoicomonas sp.]|uniref:GNAT family N-acetyltransferase n=1 Tax=uncultured Endozoicomonas sp. TaxID=432652 RepID=UPI00260B1258|nr:GNAT family N-acetyltransferase [uncultured Endozoicomonas sp.]